MLIVLFVSTVFYFRITFFAMVVNLNIIRDEASTKSDNVGFELIEIVFRVNRSVFLYY